MINYACLTSNTFIGKYIMYIGLQEICIVSAVGLPMCAHMNVISSHYYFEKKIMYVHQSTLPNNHKAQKQIDVGLIYHEYMRS